MVYSITQDRAGVLWLGTHGRGLSEFDPATGLFAYHLQRGKENGLSSNYIHDAVEDGHGTLWIGTQEGLNTYDRETGQWHWFQHDPGDPQSLSHNWIMSLYLDRSGTLWVGTLGGGLGRLALSELGGSDPAMATFAHYTEQDGLANNMVLDIVEGGGYLWICTANGLSRYDPRTGTFKNYNAGDGLPINEFTAALVGEGGELFFGGINGFVSFYPDQMEDNLYVPPVVLTSLQQNGVEVNTGRAPEDVSEVTFHWPDTLFEFGFAALSYTLPAKNQHAYKLEGFDRNWNYIGNRRFGRYTNLPGGTYTLRLLGSNNDGVWNEEGTSVKVTVVPPFWQTGWFWGIVGLILVGTILGGYRLRVRSLEARSQELQRQVEERTAELRNEIDQRLRVEEALRQREREKAVTEERNRLARELHDSVTQALYGVALYSEAAAGQLALGQVDQAAKHLIELQDTAQEALAEMRLLVFELRPPHLEEQGLVAALQARLQAVEGRAGLQTEFKTDVQERLPLDVEEGLYRIALEALNNALKHAKARSIQVSLYQQPPQGTLLLEVADDGTGFDPATAHERGGLGLAAMHERAEALGGQLTVWSEPGSGARIRVVWTGDEGGEPNG
jgi:signal transduction histidine kinase/streptogramin lyase